MVGTTPIAFNASNNGAAWYYDQTGAAGVMSIYGNNGGNLQLSVATSGTAGSPATLTSALGINGNGGIEVGSSYVGSSAPPSNGAIIQGNVGLGTSNHLAGPEVADGSYLLKKSINNGSATTIDFALGK